MNMLKITGPPIEHCDTLIVIYCSFTWVISQYNKHMHKKYYNHGKRIFSFCTLHPRKHCVT